MCLFFIITKLQSCSDWLISRLTGNESPAILIIEKNAKVKGEYLVSLVFNGRTLNKTRHLRLYLGLWETII